MQAKTQKVLLVENSWSHDSKKAWEEDGRCVTMAKSHRTACQDSVFPANAEDVWPESLA